MRSRSWTEEQLTDAVRESTSIRQVIFALGLKPAGGNYSQIAKYISELGLDVSHLKGRCWNKGMVGSYFAPQVPLDDILKRGCKFQSHRLKQRLCRAGLKEMKCEKCGWSRTSADGRLPLELHHVNGDNSDNRLLNLIILCPNCHSLEPNYRGRKK